jgi:hypothetical protein
MSNEPSEPPTDNADIDEAEEQEAEPDDGEPSPERQAELRAAYKVNSAAGKAPYESVIIASRGELHWVLREHRWSGEAQLPEGYERANLSGANLSFTNVRNIALWGADASRVNLEDADLSGAELAFANLSGALINSTKLNGAHLLGADLSEADLSFANLEKADLASANLSGADLMGTNLSGARLLSAKLHGADLNTARMDATTVLRGGSLDCYTCLADVVWNGAPLTRLNWRDVTILGDEHAARQLKDEDGKLKDMASRLEEHSNAVMAYRQVATVLRSQGLNEHADRFAYRAQVLQRELLQRQHTYGRWLFSAFLDALAGYGYAPERSLLAYLLAIVGFGIAYFLLGQPVGPHLSPLGAFVFSMTSFHGRGFFPGGIALDDPITVLAAFEAFTGLVIEVSFIATFTQRFLAR